VALADQPLVRRISAQRCHRLEGIRGGVRFRYADRANRTLVTLEASQKDGAGGH